MRRFRALFVPAVFLVGLVVLSTLAGDQQLPEKEQELFEYGSRHLNRRQWREADRAFSLCIEKYPDGKLAEQAHLQLGRLHTYYSRRYETAREWLEKLCARYPEGTQYWPARFLIAETYSRAKRTEPAIAELRRIARRAPRLQQRSRAAQQILRLKGKYFNLYVNRTFTEGEEAFVQLSSRGVDSVRYTAYRIDYAELIERLDPKNPSLPAAARLVPREQWKVISAWVSTYDVSGRRYQNRKVIVPEVRRGFHVVEALHDGVTMTVAFPVNRYGMIVKTAAGRSLIFAQDRTTGQPVSGMRVRVLEADGEREVVTDEAGTAVVQRSGQRGFLIGSKEGDYAFSNVRTWGWQAGKESRYYVTTDRPIYRPNQQVHFKIIHRTEEGARLEVQKDLRVKVKVLDPKGNELYSAEKTVNEFGSLSGSFLLGAEPPLGRYRIQVDPLVASAPVLDWRGRFGDFRVDEYRKPEFKVEVEFDRGYYVLGDRLKATIAADYYFGSPVPNAKVSYRVLRRAHWPRPNYRHGWYRWYVEDWGYRPRNRGDQVAAGEGRTDAQGRLEIEVPLARWDYDAMYTVVAKVTELSRRAVEGAGAVRVNRAEFSLTASTDRYVYRPGDTVKLKVAAARPDGQPVGGRKISVTAYRRRWNRQAKRYDESELVTGGAVTAGNGEVGIPIVIAEAGSFLLKVTATDRRGNVTTTQRWLWVASRDWDGGQVNWNGVDIVPDKVSYQPGDSATLLISSEVRDQTVLVTLEASRVFFSRTVKLNGHTATVTVKLDDPALAPNVYACVTSLYRSKVYRRQRSLMIDPSSRFLDVEIRPDRAKYKPRQQAAVEIITRDRSGKPVSAEVSLAVVDESIFALQAPYARDIRRFFVRKRQVRVLTSTSLEYRQWGEGSLEAKEGVADRGAGAPAAGGLRRGRGGKKVKALGSKLAYAETEVRSKFADTMSWTASVVTDEQGRATVRIDRIFDNLTTWRLTARAMSRDGRMGQAQESIVVRKDVIVRLHLPRFFTQGDRTTVSAVVHNYLSEKKPVKVVLRATGIELAGALERIVEVEPRGERRIDWPAKISTPGVARITVKALTDEESDAMELEVPVYPHGSLAWSSSTHLVDGRLDTTVDLPGDAIPGATEMIITVSPTHAATVLDALDYLADYPYGCVEQTMSRFLPSTITAQVLRKLNLSRPELEKELPAMIHAGLQRLYNFQRRDGGWGWWKNDSSNLFTTAYVVYGLAMAREADVAVSARVFDRGVQALQGLLAKADDDEQRVYMLYALSVAGNKVPGVRNALADNLDRLSAVHKAMLALVLHRDGEAREAARVLKSLEGDAKSSGAAAYFSGPKHYRWTGHNVETTAYALRAFLKIAPDHPLVGRIVAWLAMSREGDHWASTRQTATVVLAMADYLQRTGDLDPDLTLTLKVNGRLLLKQRVTKANWRSFDGNVRVDRALLRTGKNRVELLAEGRGKPVCSIYLRHFKRAESFEASKGGLQVERRYELVRTDGKAQFFVPLEAGAKVRSGDEVRVTLTIRADRTYRYLMLEDPMPSGFEAVREQTRQFRYWRWWYSHKEYRDEKVAVAITSLPEGERKIFYTMRAETPGKFKVLPTLVWNMYRAGQGANSRGRSIQVVD